jgi:hypothetical protein
MENAVFQMDCTYNNRQYSQCTLVDLHGRINISREDWALHLWPSFWLKILIITSSAAELSAENGHGGIGAGHEGVEATGEEKELP